MIISLIFLGRKDLISELGPIIKLGLPLYLNGFVSGLIIELPFIVQPSPNKCIKFGSLVRVLFTESSEDFSKSSISSNNDSLTYCSNDFIY